MADDDYGKDVDPDEAIAEAEKQLRKSGDVALREPDDKSDRADASATSDDPHDKSGAMHVDPGDTLPPQGTGRGEGRGEMDIPGLTTEYTPEEQMKLLMDQFRKSRDSIDQLHARTAPMWEKYRAMLQQDQNIREQTNMGMGDSPTPQMPSHQQQTWLGAISQFLAVAIPVAMMFGIRGNGFAKGAMMSAMGSFLKNYKEGRDGAAKADWEQWKAQRQAIHQSNQERHQIYKDILANKRLALDDQFKMIHSVAQEFQDPIMAKGSRMSDMQAIIKHLENQAKVNQRFHRVGAKVEQMIKPRKPRDWPEYVEHIKSVSRQKGREINPDTDPEAANAIEDYDTWAQHKKTTAEKSAEQKAAREKPQEPSNEDTRKQLFGDE